MRQSVRLGWALLVAVVAGALAEPAAAQTTLRYKFKAGDKIDYVLVQDMKMAMKAGGKDINTTMNQNMDMTWHVLKVDDDGNARIQIKMGRVKMSMKGGPIGNIEVDSASDKQPEDAVGKSIANVVGAIADMEMTFTMTPTGDMKDVKMSEKSLKALKGMPGADQLCDLFSAEGMKRLVQSGMTLPKNPVKKGDSWTQQQNVKLPFGKMTGDVKYTYEGPGDKDGKTVEKIAIKPELKIEANPNSPFKMTVKDQQSKGTVYFDNKAGRIAGMTNAMTMNLAIEVGNTTIDQSIVQNTTMRLKTKSSSREE